MNVFKHWENGMIELGGQFKKIGGFIAFVFFVLFMIFLLAEFLMIAFTGSIIIISFK